MNSFETNTRTAGGCTHPRGTRHQGTLKTPMTRDAGGSMANLGENKRKKARYWLPTNNF